MFVAVSISTPVRIRRRGLTLVELLTVIAVTGILIALALSAAQSARESARRFRCANNLRQIGLAMFAYTETNHVLPPASNGMGFSAHVTLLPYLEQAPLYNAFNQSCWASDPANGAARATRVAAFLCPSDTSPGDERIGFTNYAGNGGFGPQKFGLNGALVPHGREILLDGSWVPLPRPWGLEGLTDGTSTTAAFAEWCLGPVRLDDPDPRRGVFTTPGPLTAASQFEQFAESCRDLDPGAPGVIVDTRRKGWDWTQGNVVNTIYLHTLGVNGRSCLNGSSILDWQGAYTAGSPHGGGANVLFAGGQVRFVKDSISLATWRALGSRNGGENVSGDAD